jgi:1,6-anhydro-N-acetylmuramate kinase
MLVRDVVTAPVAVLNIGGVANVTFDCSLIYCINFSLFYWDCFVHCKLFAIHKSNRGCTLSFSNTVCILILCVNRYVGGDDSLIGFDTGPGNALIDDWIHHHDLGLFDVNGGVASRGVVHWDRIRTIMTSSSFFKAPPPKSLDRNDFSSSMVEVCLGSFFKS